ncbi:MAG: GAF domain-containing protein [bacterium]|nr:GAF domain-containing protein [bacterium]
MNQTQITKDNPGLAKKVDSLSCELLFCYEELDFIFETGIMLSSIAKGEISDWKSIASEILENSLEMFEAEFGWIYFIDEKDSSIEIKELKGVDGERIKDISSLLAARIEDGAFMLDTLTVRELGFEKKTNASDLICAPFRCGEKPFGALVLGRKKGGAFTSSHMKLLSHFSGYCAQVLENAKMFQEIKDAYRLSEEANVRLTQLNKMKENFMSITSHELKTPLSIISMCTDIIKNNDLAQ